MCGLRNNAKFGVNCLMRFRHLQIFQLILTDAIISEAPIT